MIHVGEPSNLQRSRSVIDDCVQRGTSSPSSGAPSSRPQTTSASSVDTTASRRGQKSSFSRLDRTNWVKRCPPYHRGVGAGDVEIQPVIEGLKVTSVPNVSFSAKDTYYSNHYLDL